MSKKLALIFIPYTVLTSSVSVLIQIWSVEHCTRKSTLRGNQEGTEQSLILTETNHTTRQRFPNTTMTTGDISLLLFLPYLMDQQKQYNKYKTINSIHQSCEYPPLQNLLNVYYHPIWNHFLQFPFRKRVINNLILKFECSFLIA